MSEAEIRGLIAQFLFEWIKWVEAGAGEPHFIFDRSSGLCTCLMKYMRRTCQISEISMASVEGYFQQTLLHGDITPFNRGNQKAYPVEASEGTLHKNPARRHWAYQMLRELQR